ncbi:MAG: hypothetical protein BGO98_38010 [Myxococcales bacterium 68-20]|nr:MAG: hypothetical protein BGO98_38010 [Myxococcales bacterium 68-20]
MFLDWSVPPECPSAQTVAAQVTAIVGPELPREPLVVEGRVEVEDDPRRYRLELRIRLPEDEGTRAPSVRVMESSDCQKLGDAASLVISLDLQSRARLKGEATARSPATTQRARLAPPSRKRKTERLHGGLGADASGDLGSLPRVAGGGGVHAFVRYGALRGELGAMLWPRSEAAANSPFGGGAYLSLRTVSLTGCYAWLSRPELSACLHAEGGSLRSTSFGIGQPGTSTGAWFSAFLGLAARPLTWDGLSPRFVVEIGTPLRYGEVVIERIGRIHAPTTPLLRFGIALDVDLF